MKKELDKTSTQQDINTLRGLSYFMEKNYISFFINKNNIHIKLKGSGVDYQTTTDVLGADEVTGIVNILEKERNQERLLLIELIKKHPDVVDDFLRN